MTTKPEWKREMDRNYIGYLEAFDYLEVIDDIDDLSAVELNEEITDMESVIDSYWERIRENREEEMALRRQAWLER